MIFRKSKSKSGSKGGVAAGGSDTYGGDASNLGASGITGQSNSAPADYDLTNLNPNNPFSRSYGEQLAVSKADVKGLQALDITPANIPGVTTLLYLNFASVRPSFLTNTPTGGTPVNVVPGMYLSYMGYAAKIISVTPTTITCDTQPFPGTSSSGEAVKNCAVLDPSKVVYPCLIPAAQLSELFGYQQPNADLESGLTYWRTLSFTIPGNSLKIENLPSRKSDVGVARNAYPFGGDVPRTYLPPGGLITPESTPSVPKFTPYYNMIKNAGAELDLYGTQWVAFGAGTTNDRYKGGNYLQSWQRETGIIIQFEKQTESPFIAREGEIYRTTFNTVFVTFRISQPRFRLIIGNNSEVINDPSTPIINSNLAMSPGLGLYKNSSIHPTPFCLTQTQLVPKASLAPGVAFSLPTTGGSWKLIENTSNTTPYNAGEAEKYPGTAVLWITSIDIAHFAAATATAIYLNWAFTIQDPSGKVLRTLTQAFLNCADSSAVSNGARNIQFATPLRVTLAAGECLVMTITNPRAFACNIIYAINGYSMGQLSISPDKLNDDGTNTTTNGTQYTRVYPGVVYAEHPFPMDQINRVYK